MLRAPEALQFREGHFFPHQSGSVDGRKNVEIVVGTNLDAQVPHPIKEWTEDDLEHFLRCAGKNEGLGMGKRHFYSRFVPSYMRAKNLWDQRSVTIELCNS